MSATRLLVLGVVRICGVAHGYQVRRELESWNADKWANVQPGSIYHALKKMAAEGLLEQVESESGRGPDRTGYRITEDGERYFDELLQAMLGEVRDDYASVDLAAAVAFFPMLSRDRAISLLKFRVTQLKGQQANLEVMLRHGTEWGQPVHVGELYRMWLAQTNAAMTWAAELIDRLRAGEYVMADDSESAFGSATSTTL